MHRLFQIDEVLREIFIHLGAHDLIHLTRTCKAFKDPAIDTIWLNAGSIPALVKLLPEGLVIPGDTVPYHPMDEMTSEAVWRDAQRDASDYAEGPEPEVEEVDTSDTIFQSDVFNSGPGTPVMASPHQHPHPLLSLYAPPEPGHQQEHGSTDDVVPALANMAIDNPHPNPNPPLPSVNQEEPAQTNNTNHNDGLGHPVLYTNDHHGPDPLTAAIAAFHAAQPDPWSDQRSEFFIPSYLPDPPRDSVCSSWPLHYILNF